MRTGAPRPAAPLAEGLSLQGLSASRSNARRPAQTSGRTRCARTAPCPRRRAFVGGLNGSPRTPCWESPSARSRLTECSRDSRRPTTSPVALSRLRATVNRHPAARVDDRASQAGDAVAAGADRRTSARPPERLDRKERSSHGAGDADERPQAGTGAVRARDHHVRGASASSRSAGDGRRPVDRRDETIFAGEPLRRGSGVGGTTRRPTRETSSSNIEPALNRYVPCSCRHDGET
jgi:hypothetical protein